MVNELKPTIVYFARPNPMYVSMRVDLLLDKKNWVKSGLGHWAARPLRAVATGLLLAKPYRCTMFALVKISSFTITGNIHVTIFLENLKIAVTSHRFCMHCMLFILYSNIETPNLKH